jgi:3-hydroxyacyl-CoA dehydrogenase
LGGDLEMTMACHYRMVAQVMNVGLLEVKLGLVPGSADTRRLPRLIGLPNALEYMTRAIP